MHLQRLSLTHFRNYARLELSLPAGLTIVQGENAQGKSNLLEAITYLATSRSPRTSSDGELVNWLIRDDPLPFTRLAAEVVREGRVQRLDITLMAGNSNGRYRKQVRINGANKRALDLVGQLMVVLFRPEDVDLVSGSPSLRRRYLDVALCQIEPMYCRSLSQYNKALSQRNALLRQLKEMGKTTTDQLRYWNEQLAELGSLVIYRRQWLINALESVATLRHLDLSGGFERMRMRYLPSFDPSQGPDANAARYAAAPLLQESGADYGELTQDQIRASFLTHLQRGQSRDVAAKMTLLGPHRDDLGFYLGDRNLRTYGSRGQQRTAALASKLAEVEVMRQVSDEAPILLLDDVMSELDAGRRRMLIDGLETVEQAIVTTTDWQHFSDSFLAKANSLHVSAGQLKPFRKEDGGE